MLLLKLFEIDTAKGADVEHLIFSAKVCTLKSMRFNHYVFTIVSAT